MWLIFMIFSAIIYAKTDDTNCLIVVALCFVASAIHRICNIIKSSTENGMYITLKDEQKSNENDSNSEQV